MYAIEKNVIREKTMSYEGKNDIVQVRYAQKKDLNMNLGILRNLTHWSRRPLRLSVSTGKRQIYPLGGPTYAK